MRVGILGGGQLARMMALAGYPLGLDFLIVDPKPDACAAALGEHLVADYDDPDALDRLARETDVVTFDFENVPETAARALADRVAVFPPPTALAVGQDRLHEKQLFDRLDIPTPAYRTVDSRPELLAAVEQIGLPAVLKTRRFGYDGKGQAVLRQQEDMERAWQRLSGRALILEGFVDYQAECSAIAVRARNGEIRFWPVGRNVHKDGVLAATLSPWGNEAIAEPARQHAAKLLEHFDYCGVFALEYFVRDGRLLANEFAPRVHNSGHWTIDGAVTSQFENHLRAVCGMPLGDTAARGVSLMLNLIGDMPSTRHALGLDQLHWHAYGKAPRPGRKLGHATLTGATAEALLATARTLDWPAPVVRDALDDLTAGLRG